MVGPSQGKRVRWRWAAASAIGTSHIRSGERLQDAFVVSGIGKDHVLAIVCDGAGSAEFGASGAWIACRFLSVRFREWLSKNTVPPADNILADWIDALRDEISAIAKRRNLASRQFAATLAAILISPDEVLAIHIGDSAVAARHEAEWDVLCWPENGEYASSTYFLTDDPEPRLNITRQQRKYDAFALFSDGVGELALSHIDQAAFPKFLDPMVRPVDASPGIGRLPELSEKLGDYLAGDAVCERTDDDKTLILISGR